METIMIWDWIYRENEIGFPSIDYIWKWERPQIPDIWAWDRILTNEEVEQLKECEQWEISDTTFYDQTLTKKQIKDLYNKN